jgi:hypothetical protein
VGGIHAFSWAYPRISVGHSAAFSRTACLQAREVSDRSQTGAQCDARYGPLFMGSQFHVGVLQPPTYRLRAQCFALVASLEKLHRSEGVELVVIDPLATLLPGYAETSAPKLLDCLLPLQALANPGPEVWLMHHPGRGKRPDGQATRGTSALPGQEDGMGTA